MDGNPSPITTRTGSHGEQVSLLGYGAMRLPTTDGNHANVRHGGSNAAIDTEAVQRHVDYCIAHGVNYFDTSPVYCRGESERVLGDALAKHPRDKWFVATKLSNFNAKTHSFEASREMYETSKRLLHTDHIDFYLLHAIGGGSPNSMKLFNARFIDNGMLDFLLKEREAGRIRNLGFSFHGDEAVFRHALSLHGKVHWDFAQIQLNWVDWHHAKEINPRNVNAETLYNLLAERKIPAVIMEPLLGGRLARFKEAVARRLTPLDPQATPASWSFRFAGTLPGVLTVLSGMTYLKYIEENVKTYSPLKPLNDNELATLERAARAFISDDDIPCTACDYCMPCPFGLDIPGIFAVWNQAVVSDQLPDDPKDPNYAANRQRFLRDYAVIPYLRQAQRCIGCGRCAPHCPQSINIPAKIRKVDLLVERLKRDGIQMPTKDDAKRSTKDDAEKPAQDDAEKPAQDDAERPTQDDAEKPTRDDAEQPTRDDAERKTVKSDTHREIRCLFCKLCMPCRYGLDIPGIFRVWNRAVKEGWLPKDPSRSSDAKNGRRFLRAYSRVTAGYRQAQRCIGCGDCVKHCPLAIDIPGQLRKIDGFVEKLKRNCRA